jgi:hypothetical protein
MRAMCQPALRWQWRRRRCAPPALASSGRLASLHRNRADPESPRQVCSCFATVESVLCNHKLHLPCAPATSTTVSPVVAPKAIMLPPSRPVSNSSSTESTLTRELSRHDLSVDPGGAATGSGGGNGINGHHSHHGHQQQPQQQQQQNSSQRGVDALTFSKVPCCPSCLSHIHGRKAAPVLHACIPAVIMH